LPVILKMNRRAFLALTSAALIWRPADEEKSDDIGYWLLAYEEFAEFGRDDEAVEALSELRQAIEREGIPQPWRDAYFVLKRVDLRMLVA
jgi:hypothetical protein